MGSSAGKEGGQRDPGVKKDGKDVLRAGGGGVAAARLRRCLLSRCRRKRAGGGGGRRDPTHRQAKGRPFSPPTKLLAVFGEGGSREGERWLS